jgi:hypothetical protein
MIEILESRIAPAAVFFYTDVDGDHVKITSSLGTNTELAAAVTLSNSGTGKANIGVPHQLETLTLGSAFSGASISITATPSDDLNPTTKTISGDGFVNVGEILAGTIDLKSVSVHGDLGQIVVGLASTTNPGKTPGLGSLNVQSMGDFGTTTGANGTASRFINGATSIIVAHDVNGVLLRAVASDSSILTTAKLGSVTIGGNLIGGATTDTGEVAADIIGSIKIMGNVIGGTAFQTGRIATNVNGALSGGASPGPLGKDAGNIGSVYIGGDMVGGSAQATGVIFTPTNLGMVTVKGSVLGGSAITSGGIDGATIGAVAIGGDLLGTQFSSATAVDHTAFIRSQTNLKSVTIGGSVQPGVETGGGALTFSGAIQAGQTLGPVKILGSIFGNSTNTVIISGAGLPIASLAAPLKHDPAITSVSVKGSATYAQIEAGYDLNGNAFSGDASIGAVAIGGDLIASDIIAGVKSTSADFGNTSDTMIVRPAAATSDGILATIASIVVGGQIEGTAATGDMFGIEAQLIGSIKVGTLNLPMTKGPGNDGFFISGTTGKDVHIRELAGT